MVIYTICLVHIFYNLDFFFFFPYLLFVSFKRLDGMPCCLFFFFFFFFFFPLMECHVVFGKMLYGMDVVYKSEVEGYLHLLFWDVIGQIYINFTIYLEMVFLRKVFKNLIHSPSISKLFS